jgi:hypothetical protein
MSVYIFPRHKLKNCDGACLETYSCHRCPICEWGAAICETCGGAEGELTRDCPQVKMSEEQRDAVLKGQLNFDRRQGWHKPQVRCTSA